MDDLGDLMCLFHISKSFLNEGSKISVQYCTSHEQCLHVTQAFSFSPLLHFAREQAGVGKRLGCSKPERSELIHKTSHFQAKTLLPFLPCSIGGERECLVVYFHQCSGHQNSGISLYRISKDTKHYPIFYCLQR